MDVFHLLNNVLWYWKCLESIDLWQLQAWPFILSVTGQTLKTHCHITMPIYKALNIYFLAGFVTAKYIHVATGLFPGVSYWIKSSASPRDSWCFLRKVLNITTYCCEGLTNTLITTLVSGELFIWGLFEQCQIFMNNTYIHFEWKVLSGTLPKHETCQNYLHLFAESPESVFRSMASLLPHTLYALAVLDWAKVSVK